MSQTPHVLSQNPFLKILTGHLVGTSLARQRQVIGNSFAANQDSPANLGLLGSVLDLF
jgi:hypothetical protein